MRAATLVLAIGLAVAGCESVSEEPQPTPDTTAPTVPANLTGTALSSTSVALEWDDSTDSGGSGLAGYRVFRNGGTTPIASPGTSSYTDSSAQPGTTYTYQVHAIDGAGNVSAGSNTANVTTPGVPDTTPPSAPQNLTATAIASNRIDLAWQASTDTGGSGVAGYQVFRNGSTSALASVTGTSFSDTTAAPATAYTYRVRAVDGAGNISALSNQAGATTPAAADTTPPSVPGNLTASAIGPMRIDLSWQASTDTGGSGLANYRVFRNGSATALATVASTSYSDTAVASSTMYSYQVRAVDQAGNASGLSNVATATTPAFPASGLDARPANATCVAWNKPAEGNSIQVARVFPQLPAFTFPVAMLQAPGNPSRWYVVEQTGLVRAFNNVSNVASYGTFVDISDRLDSSGSEKGLLGMAFHPDYPTDPRVFFSYTTSNKSRITAIRTTDGGATLNRTTEQIILEIDDPNQYHNGGHIAFSPTDGYLYIGIGDGGGAGDQLNPFFPNVGNGQHLGTMLGKMLRIDVDGTPAPGRNYGIPPSNPFAANTVCPSSGRASGACPEIYAFGFRNPWRWSFDRQNGDLWVGDVGQDSFEEVDLVTLGGNYGWRCREGAHNYNLSCGSQPNRLDPVAEYGRDDGQSITGGYVYRGAQPTALQGRYLFGDFVTGRIWAWIPGGAPLVPTRLISNVGFNISSFGEDNDGELYLVNYGSGTLHRILFQAGSGGTVPSSLSATGCFSGSPARPVSGLVPYDINAPFWSDGLSKERFIGLPDASSISVQPDHDWNFPVGTVLVKNFRLGSQLIETRLLMRHPDDGSWSGYTYEWNSGGTNATRIQGGARKQLSSGQEWIFPSEAECLQCHTSVTGRALGPETAQMNRDFAYPAPGRTANQLVTHSFIGTVAPPYPADPQTQPTMPNPADTGANLTSRARAYLHTNCSQCHRPGSGIAQLDLRYTTPLGSTNACGVAPGTVTATELQMPADSQLIFPGNPTKSALLNRMSRRDTHQMPRLGSTLVDTAGAALIDQWITQLASCQ